MVRSVSIIISSFCILLGIFWTLVSFRIPNISFYSFGPNKNINYGEVNLGPSAEKDTDLEVVYCVSKVGKKLWCYYGKRLLGFLKIIEAMPLNDKENILVKKKERTIENQSDFLDVKTLTKKEILANESLLFRDLFVNYNRAYKFTTIIYAE